MNVQLSSYVTKASTRPMTQVTYIHGKYVSVYVSQDWVGDEILFRRQRVFLLVDFLDTNPLDSSFGLIKRD